jgi:hypothetical protein
VKNNMDVQMLLKPGKMNVIGLQKEKHEDHAKDGEMR